MSLPPSVREDVALRLLESLETPGQESVDESWTTEIGSRVDEMVSGDVQMVPARTCSRSLLIDELHARPRSTHDPRLRLPPGGAGGVLR